MESFKKKVLVAVAMLVLALILAACGSNDTLSGTYVAEGANASGERLTFNNDSFTIEVSYAELDLGIDITGNFSFTGTFTVDDDAQTIRMRADIDVLHDAVAEMVNLLMDYMFENDPDIVEMMEDPELAEFVIEFMDAFMDELLDEMKREMQTEFSDWFLRFEDNFDRLYYDDGTVFVRQ